MKKLMTTLLFFTITIEIGTGCAHSRTRDSDERLTVAVLETKHDGQIGIQGVKKALLDSSKFYVVDRGNGYEAAKKEQTSEWKSDRFNAAKSYAEYGELYGVGSLVVPVSACIFVPEGIFHKAYYKCSEQLSIVNTKTSEVVAMCSHTVEVENGTPIHWEECVEELVEQYPKVFEGDKRTAELKTYEASLVEKKAVQDMQRIIKEVSVEEQKATQELDKMFEETK